MGVEIWTTDEANKLRATARNLFSRHDHTKTTDPLTRANCGACVLGGYKADPATGPDYAGWTRLYVQAGYEIPKKWHAAFAGQLNDENEAYAAGLARDVATFGVVGYDVETETDPAVLATDSQSDTPPVQEPNADTIELDENTQVYYSGVAAGATASDQLDGVSSDFQGRSNYFWLRIGTLLAQRFPAATQEQVALYVRGAGLRAPEAPTVAFELQIPSIDNAAFGFENYEEERDEDAALAEIARILHRTAQQVEDGTYEGTLHDVNGANVGRFTLNFSA